MTSGDWNISHQSTLLLARQAIGMEVLRAECCNAIVTTARRKSGTVTSWGVRCAWPLFCGPNTMKGSLVQRYAAE